MHCQQVVILISLQPTKPENLPIMVLCPWPLTLINQMVTFATMFVQLQLKSAENKYTNNQCTAKGKKKNISVHASVCMGSLCLHVQVMYRIYVYKNYSLKNPCAYTVQ